MNKIKTIFLTSVFVFSGVSTFAQNPVAPQNDNAYYVSEGMELIKLDNGGALVVPRGAKIRKEGLQTIVEGDNELMARKFAEMEERFAKIEKTQDELKKAVEALLAALQSVLPKNSPTPLVDNKEKR